MAGHEPFDDPSLKGISRYFNNTTIRGRANVAMATLGGLTLFFIYKKIKKSGGYKKWLGVVMQSMKAN
ncbi:ATP synthase regulation [Popillia japonica]|uniref:ATP synthase regulation n=1 Tax=Popillia japonica TaxID=7064 RepID=A0AAW1MIH3_POPJA